jgi:hypothetical protein
VAGLLAAPADEGALLPPGDELGDPEAATDAEQQHLAHAAVGESPAEADQVVGVELVRSSVRSGSTSTQPAPAGASQALRPSRTTAARTSGTVPRARTDAVVTAPARVCMTATLVVHGRRGEANRENMSERPADIVRSHDLPTAGRVLPRRSAWCGSW